jgi:hypothetical protein
MYLCLVAAEFFIRFQFSFCRDSQIVSQRINIGTYFYVIRYDGWYAASRVYDRTRLGNVLGDYDR